MSVGREFYIDGRAHALTKRRKNRVHLFYERGSRNKPFECHQEVVFLEVDIDPRGLRNMSVTVHGNHVLHVWYFIPEAAQQIGHGHRFETFRFQVDNIHHGGRIMTYFIGADVHPERGLPRRNEHRVIVAHPVNGARAESRHKANEAVLTPEPRRPAELIVAEGDARKCREKVAPHSGADNLLDHDTHLLVKVKQTALGAILDGIRAKDRRVHLGNRVEERGKAFLLTALVGQKQAFIFSRKCGARPVFQQA